MFFVSVPLTTYVLGPHVPGLSSNYPDLKGCELCENVIYLGKLDKVTVLLVEQRYQFSDDVIVFFIYI